jgi:hypothetical protein
MPAHLLLQQRRLPLSVCILLCALELSWWARDLVQRRGIAPRTPILQRSSIPLEALVLVLWRGLVSQACILMDKSSIFCSPASALLSWLVDPPQALILLGCSTAPHRLDLR